jgi:hypothetical protein
MNDICTPIPYGIILKNRLHDFIAKYTPMRRSTWSHRSIEDLSRYICTGPNESSYLETKSSVIYTSITYGFLLVASFSTATALILKHILPNIH